MKPGQFTVAIAALNTPPLALFAADNRRLIGSEVDIAQLVADSLGLTLNVVQTSWEDWPLGVVSGKYDAAITNVTVTKERKTRFDFATYRIDSLGFYVKTGGKIATIKQPADIAGLKLSSAPAPIRKPSCWHGTSRIGSRGLNLSSQST